MKMGTTKDPANIILKYPDTALVILCSRKEILWQENFPTTSREFLLEFY